MLSSKPVKSILENLKLGLNFSCLIFVIIFKKNLWINFKNNKKKEGFYPPTTFAHRANLSSSFRPNLCTASLTVIVVGNS